MYPCLKKPYTNYQDIKELKQGPNSTFVSNRILVDMDDVIYSCYAEYITLEINKRQERVLLHLLVRFIRL